MTPTKVLVFAHALQRRGTERAVIRLLHHFDRDLIDARIVLAVKEGGFVPDVPADVPVVDLGLDGKKTARAFWPLHREIRRFDPDCALGVHTSPSRVLALQRLLRPSLRVLCLEADPFVRLERAKGAFRARSLATAVTHRVASHIIAGSQVVFDDLVSHLRVPSRKVSLIPLPAVDEEIDELIKEPAHEPPFDEHDPIVVNVGHFFAHKGHSFLLEAFALLSRRSTARLALIGDGPLRNDLEAQAHSLGISERVFFLGAQRNPFKFLARASVYVSPSIAEGFDIAQVEAMYCGVPVVVTDAPRFEAVRDGETGRVVPPGDAPALADVMEHLISDNAYAQSLATRARPVAAQLSAASIARRYERLITNSR